MSTDEEPRWVSHLERWAPWGALAIAVVVLVAGAATLVHTIRFVQGADRAAGTVIELRSEVSDGDEVFYPVVRFTTAEGRSVEFVSSSGSSPPSESVGDEVEVLYDPDDPNDAQLSGFFHLWLWPLVLGPLGLIFGCFALFAPRFGLLATPSSLERRFRRFEASN